MSWTSDLVWFDGEDEEETLDRFIANCVRYPHADVIDIGIYTFKDMRDKDSRGAQAGLYWSRKLDVKERIRKAKINGGVDAVKHTKQSMQQDLLVIAQDANTSPKDRIAAYRLISEMDGLIAKPADSGSANDKKPKTFIYNVSQYDD